MTAFFNEIFYRPLLNALVVLTRFLPFHDLGVAVILLTIVVRFLLFPLSHRPLETQHKMRLVEPELQKIREATKDRETQAKETMALYKRHGINPMAGIFLLIVQIPLFLALYRVFSKSAAIDPSALYSFVSAPSFIHTNFLGIFDLTKRSIFLAAIASVMQFAQLWITNHFSASAPKSDFSRALSLQMTYGMPVVIFIVSLSFPSAVSLYWTTSTVFSIVHEGFVRRKLKNQTTLNGTRDAKNSRDYSSPAR